MITYDWRLFVAIGSQLLSMDRFDACVKEEYIYPTSILFKSLGKIDDWRNSGKVDDP